MLDNMDIPRTVASAFSYTKNLNYDDVLSAALEAFWGAALSYDPSSDASFRTWAGSKIRWGLKDWARDMDNLSRTYRTRVRAIQTARRTFRETHGCYPSDTEAARLTGFTVDQARRITELSHRADILPLFYDHQEADPHNAIKDIDNQDAFDALLRKLPSEQARVIRLIFQHDTPRVDIAHLLNISVNYVFQLRDAALRELRYQLAQDAHT